MFDNVRDMPPALARAFTPPVPVWVDLGQVYRAGVGRVGDRATLYVRAQGIPLEQVAPGVLYAWVRTTTGAWLGYVAYALDAGKTLGSLRACHLVAADSLKPRPDAGAAAPHE